MEYAELKTWLQPHLNQEVEVLYTRFRQAGNDSQPDRFLEFLLHQQQISQELFQEYHASKQVELTVDIDSTLARASGEDPVGTGSPRLSGRQHYLRLKLMGEGAMGQVFLARDRDLHRKVALKQLHQQTAQSRDVLRRFVSEMQITAQLDHPNVLPVYSLEMTANGSLAYTMKVVRGKTFKELIQETRAFYRQGRQPEAGHSLAARLEHFLKVCDAMAYAHTKGVIHRDLKPANIMLGQYNEVYVMDWGIARLCGSGPEFMTEDDRVELARPDSQEPIIERTQIGQIIGTPRYMSPEQAKGRNEELDGCSDQFSLGLILFELVTLKPAITGKTQIEVLKRILKGEKDPFTPAVGKFRCPPELQAIVTKATALDPTQRYPTVAAMAGDIRRFLRDESVSAYAEPLAKRTLRWLNVHRQLTLALVTGCLIVSAAATIWNLYQQQTAMVAAHTRENRLAAFLTAIAHKSQEMDSRFLEIEVLLEGLAAATSEILLRSQPASGPLFRDTDFSNRRRLPPDYAYAPRYSKLISTDWPVFQLAPGFDPRQAQPAMQNLAPLRPYFKELLLASRTRRSEPLAATAAAQVLRREGVPVLRAYIGLESGLHYSYPGNKGYPVGFDVRQQPWYRQAMAGNGLQWAKPQVDVLGQGLILSCIIALRNGEDRLGVAGLDLTFDYIIRSWMDIPAVPAIETTYMVDSQGRTVLSSTDRARKQGLRFGEEQLAQVLDSPIFPVGEVVRAIQLKQTGFTQYQRDGRNRLLAYYPLNATGWYFVAAADADRVFGDR